MKVYIIKIQMSGEFDIDFTSKKTPFPYLKKGSGKRMTNAKEEKAKFDFLRKNGGTLASSYHGTTEFALKRAQDVIETQHRREIEHHRFNEEMTRYLEDRKSRK